MTEFKPIIDKIERYHYPPELIQILIDTIPLLCRSKTDVLTFFRGAGIAPKFTSDLAKIVKENRQSISKYQIARTVLTRINEEDESCLKERREILKRITEWDDFSTCWPDDLLKAKGLVSEVRDIVGKKDAFTRMAQEREKEVKTLKEKHAKRAKIEEARKEDISKIRASFFELFSTTNPQARGKSLEKVLNKLFKSFGMLVREDFHLCGDDGEGIIEQLDGVIELDGHIYLVEMKWLQKPVGKETISPHLVNVFNRGGQARGIFISYSNYTEPAITVCREAILQGAVIVLCDLQEIVHLLEHDGDFRDLLREKIKIALIEKKPFQKII